MRVLKSRRSKVITAAASGLALGLGLMAGAYWTGGGSGSGTTTVAATPQNVIVNQTAVTGLAPGGQKALSGTVSNPNAYQVKVDGITAGAITVDAGHPACLPADFSVTGGPALVNDIVAANGSKPWSGLTLNMADTAANQDGCKGATVTVAYTLAPFDEQALPPVPTLSRSGDVVTVRVHQTQNYVPGNAYTIVQGDTLTFYSSVGGACAWPGTLATADADGIIYYQHSVPTGCHYQLQVWHSGTIHLFDVAPGNNL